MAWSDKKMEGPERVYYDLDMSKISTIDDIKKVLAALNFHIDHNHPNLKHLKPFIKVRPNYGKG